MRVGSGLIVYGLGSKDDTLLDKNWIIVVACKVGWYELPAAKSSCLILLGMGETPLVSIDTRCNRDTKWEYCVCSIGSQTNM